MFGRTSKYKIVIDKYIEEQDKNRHLRAENKKLIAKMDKKVFISKNISDTLEEFITKGQFILDIVTNKSGQKMVVMCEQYNSYNHNDYRLRLIPLEAKKYSLVYDKMFTDLCFYKKTKKMEIIDIIITSGYDNVGNGSILLKSIDKLAKIEDTVETFGKLSNVDKDHWNKLFHFYKNNEYEIKLFENKIDGIIVKEYKK